MITLKTLLNITFIPTFVIALFLDVGMVQLTLILIAGVCAVIGMSMDVVRKWRLRNAPGRPTWRHTFFGDVMGLLAVCMLLVPYIR